MAVSSWKQIISHESCRLVLPATGIQSVLGSCGGLVAGVPIPEQSLDENTSPPNGLQGSRNPELPGPEEIQTMGERKLADLIFPVQSVESKVTSPLSWPKGKGSSGKQSLLVELPPAKLPGPTVHEAKVHPASSVTS